MNIRLNKSLAPILIFILICISYGLQSQDQLSPDGHIKNLKEGVLLVRLEDKARKVDFYKKNGNEVLAEKIEQKLATKNKAIIDNFEELFDFTDFYFFNMNDSREVLDDRNFTKLYRKDNDVIDASLLDGKELYVCTIDQGIIDKERALNHPGYQIYYLKFDGISQKFERLVRPFPNGAKYKLPFFNFTTFVKKEITKLNKDCHSFYKLHH